MHRRLQVLGSNRTLDGQDDVKIKNKIQTGKTTRRTLHPGL